MPELMPEYDENDLSGVKVACEFLCTSLATDMGLDPDELICVSELDCRKVKTLTRGGLRIKARDMYVRVLACKKPPVAQTVSLIAHLRAKNLITNGQYTAYLVFLDEAIQAREKKCPS